MKNINPHPHHPGIEAEGNDLKLSDFSYTSNN